MYVGTLILIAGPSGIGKSYFIDLLLQGNLKKFSDHLGIGESDSWKHITAKELRENPALEADRIIFHYDLTGPWKRGIQSGFMADRSLEILNVAKDATVVTLWARPEVILERYLKRQKETKSILRFLHRLAIPAKETKLYRNPSGLLSLYREWYDFCQRLNLKGQWMVNSIDNLVTHEPLSEHSFQMMTERMFSKA